MGRTFIPVKYRKDKDEYYTTVKGDSGNWQQQYLCKGPRTADNERLAWRKYEEWKLRLDPK